MKSSQVRRLIRIFFLQTILCRGRTKEKKSKESVNKEEADDSRCSCCLKPFIIGKGVDCSDCKSRIYKKSCSHWDFEDNNWHCLFCNHRRSWCKRNEKWFETFGSAESNAFKKLFITTESLRSIEDEHVFNSNPELAAGGYETTNSMENVREIIEKIVESLVGNVDNTPIDRLYTHEAYNKLIDEYGVLLSRIIKHLENYFQSYSHKPATDRPSMAHTALRELVERAVDEARKLPGLGDTVSTRTQQNTSIIEQTYEDLLAAAILNKVIEKYQKDADGNSHVHDSSSRKFINNRSKMSLDRELEDELTSPDSSSENKIRRRICSDPLSLTIEEQIEEITTTYTSDEEPECMKNSILNFNNSKRVPFPEFGMDIVDPSQESSDNSEDEVDAAHVDHVTPVESWEENWLFQKKKIAIKSEPVAMLVPNPSADYRALIGDKDAEDTSDLSEFSAQSDDEIEEELIQVISQVSHEESCDTKDKEIIASNLNDERIETQVQVDSAEAQPICHKTVETDEEIVRNVDGCSITNGNDVKSSDDLDEEEILVESNEMTNNSNVIERVPKTPTSTPTRNSVCDNEVTEINKNYCNFEKLNAKLESIDIETDVDNNDNELSVTGNNDNDNSKEIQINTEVEEANENFNATEDGKCREAAAKSESKISGTKSLERSKKIKDKDLELSAPPRPGTIAEREHKKWENAAPIENNPYSPENINKRLLERQYATRSSEVTGNSTVLPTSQSPPLQIVFATNRPDIKRFGRDYYINEAKSPRGEKFQRPGTSNSSRPSSSLSHHSSSIGSDFEQQEPFEPIEASKSLIITQSQNNNKYFERERKNSKNEINAKLNNQGTNYITSDNKNTFDEDNKRKIRRIDLRAYGFENEFYVNNNNNHNNNKDFEKIQRIPNKLDLRSFGYDSGLRRTQSNNHLDSKVNNSFVKLKISDDNNNDTSGTEEVIRKINLNDDYWARSTEALNDEKKIIFEKFNRIKAAKSVPNIVSAKTENYYTTASSSTSDEDEKHFVEQLTRDNDEIKMYGNDSIKERIIKLIDGEVTNSSDFNSYETDSQSSKTESTEELPRRFSTLKEIKYSLESLDGVDKFSDKELPMPSVKKLAQAFNTPETTKTSKLSKNLNKERPNTPEIQIIKTPRQMHSLTARSLSKEFREGLRQISVKPQAPQLQSLNIEQSKLLIASEKNSSNLDKSLDIDVIAPGKIKNGLEFWEQLQKRN
ncbi:probable serine/threonine-protein kinase DDB_G0282963 isoform X2 [Microplitis demolitor]|uniref:probable serine/threonine-protein kinase DDB_G0282963 isoform X2 n=1 Tax=Microplitis demolitor TaxID=69319 RepID=UPI00235B6B72|nr:probable serine/threonine-protein kinase DDB_G0282963 isoform X2 [Microplitis demolitor]